MRTYAGACQEKSVMLCLELLLVCVAAEGRNRHGREGGGYSYKGVH